MTPTRLVVRLQALAPQRTPAGWAFLTVDGETFLASDEAQARRIAEALGVELPGVEP
jgi:hypothetical protein